MYKVQNEDFGRASTLVDDLPPPQCDPKALESV